MDVPPLQPVVDSVMIVDDNGDDRYILKRLIRKSNLTSRVMEKVHGEEALASLTASASQESEDADPIPALIFLDINMPMMDGFEFLEAFAPLRERDALRSVILIMFSSSTHPHDVERIQQYDFVKGYIIKMPASPAELRERVRTCLGMD